MATTQKPGAGSGTAAAPFGRGKTGTGGGGGNDHNTGGGGGGNFGKGGSGGQRTNVSQFSCPGPSPGVGGAALDYTNTLNKVFMGGGGGAGDQNNNEGTAGANGGGIVIIMADVLEGNNRFIIADADSVKTTAHSDGAGAGGAGGSVLLYVNNITNSLRVTARGGKGGNLDNSGLNNYCFGPGGGGGGGVLWVKSASLLPAIQANLDGGINGMNVWTLSSICPYGATNNAEPGDTGGVVTGLIVPIDSLPFVPLTVSICCDTTVCEGAWVSLSVNAAASEPPVYVWSSGDSAASIVKQVTQSTTYQVSVSDGRFCEKILSATVTVANNPPDVIICCDTTICPGDTVQMTVINNTGNPLNYQWSNGATTPSFAEQIFFTQGYSVTVTDNSGCEAVKYANAVVTPVNVHITATPDTTVLMGQPVSLSAVGDSIWQYTWSPATGLNATDTQYVIATPSVMTKYCVTATNDIGCSASDCYEVKIVTPEIKIPDAFTPNGDGINDLFTVFPLNYAKVYSMKIYNRWGELIFETRTGEAWNGTYKGAPQPNGNYICIVDYGSPYAPDETIRITKDLQLIR
ncbi:MAG: gliding motility-associated C-terminal domain-containing protein [Chitinophagales bacterium]|nr:gliding motility-associated C-terminal domain-containing protein [Chitinophagales bacterium]